MVNGRDDDALDVWLRFPDPDCGNCGWCEDCTAEFSPYDEAEAEANTFPDGDGFRVAWYLTAVGLVTSHHFATYDAAREWLTSQGFQDFTA